MYTPVTDKSNRKHKINQEIQFQSTIDEMNVVLEWYKTKSFDTSDVIEIFDACVLDVVARCERVLRGPMLCDDTGHMSDRYSYEIDVMNCVIWMLNHVDVPGKEYLTERIESLDCHVDKRLDWYYDEYENYVLLHDYVDADDIDEVDNTRVYNDNKCEWYLKSKVNPETWSEAYIAEYQRLWQTMYGDYPCCPQIKRRMRIKSTLHRDGAVQAQADFNARATLRSYEYA